jgi:H+/gluconate symporter-like permease
MATIGIIGMLAAIAVMIIGAYRGIKAIPLTILAALVVIVTNGMGIWESLATFCGGRFGSTGTRFFFLFISSSVYAMLMDKTGSTASIGFQLIKWFGTKHVMAIVFVFTALLTYGGISLFVVFFAALPVAFVLFKEANLPRAAIMAPMGAGGAGITMTTLPGTPALTNIIPSDFLGTPLTAAPVFSLVMAAIIVVLTFFYFGYVKRTVQRNNEVFTFPPGFDASAVANIDRSKLPHPLIAFIPILTLLLFLIVSSVANAPYAENPIQLATMGMVLASIVCLALNPKKITITGVKNWIGDGANNGITAIVGLAAVIAFGYVVSNAPAFQSVLNWVTDLDMNIYFKGLVSTGVISGITGSSSGGAEIALTNLGAYFIAAGEAGTVNLEVLHRLIAMGAGTLDTLPHVSAIFLFLALLGCTHKEAYKYLFWPTVVIPSVVTVFGVVVASIIW